MSCTLLVLVINLVELIHTNKQDKHHEQERKLKVKGRKGMAKVIHAQHKQQATSENWLVRRPDHRGSRKDSRYRVHLNNASPIYFLQELILLGLPNPISAVLGSAK